MDVGDEGGWVGNFDGGGVEAVEGAVVEMCCGSEGGGEGEERAFDGHSPCWM